MHTLPVVLVPQLANTLQVIGERAYKSWPWYVIRGAGFASAALIVLLMLSGIGQATGWLYRYVEPLKAWAVHKAMAIALCGSLLLHVGFLLIDHYVSFSVSQLLVPFTSHFNNGTTILGIPLQSLGVGLGILALYGLLIIVLSSLGWIETKKHTWRWIHYLSYGVAVCIFLHAAYVGSDIKYGTFRLAWMMVGLILLVGIISRLWHTGTTKRS